MVNNIEVNDLKRILGNIKVIDIRDNYIYKLGNIPTSKNIPANFLLMNPQQYIDFNEKIYIYCDKGIKSMKVCKELLNKGYANVYNVVGGYEAYKYSK